MNKSQQKTLVLGIGSVVLLLCMILGVFVYNQPPQNEQKDTTTTNPTQPSLPSGDKGKTAPSTDPPPRREQGNLAPKGDEHLKTALPTSKNTPPFWRHAIQGFSAFFLHLSLDVVCTALVTVIGGITYVSHKSETDMNYQDWFEVIIIYTLAFAAYWMLEVEVYNAATQKQLAGILAHSIFFGVFAYIIQASDMHKNMRQRGILLLYCFLCYLTVVVWVQHFLNTVGIKGYRKTSLPALYSIDHEEVYAIVLELFKVLIPIDIGYLLICKQFVSMSMLLLVFTFGTQLSICLKLSPRFKKHKGIVSRSLLYTIFWLYITYFFDGKTNLVQKKFSAFQTSIVFVCIIDIVQYLVYPYVSQLFLGSLAFLKSFVFSEELAKQRQFAKA